MAYSHEGKNKQTVKCGIKDFVHSHLGFNWSNMENNSNSHKVNTGEKSQTSSHRIRWLFRLSTAIVVFACLTTFYSESLLNLLDKAFPVTPSEKSNKDIVSFPVSMLLLLL